jgi:hypothetical protein
VRARVLAYAGLSSGELSKVQSLPVPLEAVAVRINEHARSAETESAQAVEQLRCSYREIMERMDAWVETLASPGISAALRERLSRDYSEADVRCKAVQAAIAARLALPAGLSEAAAPAEALDRLNGFIDSVSLGNVPLLNVELHGFVHSVTVDPDGQVQLRMTLMGAFPRAIALLSSGLTDDRGSELCGLRNQVARDRFAELADDWFHSEFFRVDRPVSTCRRIAGSVAGLRKINPRDWTIDRLAAHFAVSRTTVNHAIRVAAGCEPLDAKRTGRLPRLPVDGAAIRRRRKAAGVSARKAAAAMFRCPAYLRKVELGINRFESPDRVDGLACALGCAVSDLLRQQDGKAGE